MPLKVTITVSVQDAEHDRYNDPRGNESVELYCVETSEIEQASNAVASALVKVASLKYKAEIGLFPIRGDNVPPSPAQVTQTVGRTSPKGNHEL